tara:strand:- start:976 stop:1503 length:528 start_codon:yes stop_codon:yes gene_type:complete
MKLLRYIPILAIALVLGIAPFTSAFAQSDQFQGEKVVNISGDQLLISNATTNDSFDFGFTADFVEVCIEADSAAEGAMLRFGTSVDDSAPAFGPRMNMTILATTEAIFRNGSTNVLEGRAIRIMQGGDGTDTKCNIEPWRTNGVVVAWSSIVMGETGTVSVDVTAYQTMDDRRNR